MTGYILAAVISYLGMSTFDDLPSSQSIVLHEVWMEDDAVRQNMLGNIAKHVVDCVDLSTEFKDPTSCPGASAGTVLEYSHEVLSLGLLFLELKDAVREGDGDRVLLDWKYLLLLFKLQEEKTMP